MRRTTEKEMQAVLRLDGPARFRHFVKRVADSEKAWGLWNDGWALMASDDGTNLLPLWPAREYAVLHCSGDWAHYAPKEIPLSDLLDELIPKLNDGKVLTGVFPTPGGRGTTPTTEELASALRQGLKQYE